MKNGETTPRSRRATSSRFWAKVDVRGLNDCWPWTAGTNACGYGTFDWHGKPMLAHRMMLRIHDEEIPSGMCVLHKCDNPPCVNPQHLFIGTHADNMRDMIAKKRGSGVKTLCKRGHSKLGKNAITEADGYVKCRICTNARQKRRRSERCLTEPGYHQQLIANGAAYRREAGR